jgi:hypothetical protein
VTRIIENFFEQVTAFDELQKWSSRRPWSSVIVLSHPPARRRQRVRIASLIGVLTSLLIECPVEHQRPTVGDIRMLVNIMIWPMTVKQMGVRMDEADALTRGNPLGRRRT